MKIEFIYLNIFSFTKFDKGLFFLKLTIEKSFLSFLFILPSNSFIINH